MRVFVTGATGYIGEAVVRALLCGGHAVTGLVRSAEKEARLVSAGAAPFRADLRNVSSFSAEAAAHDAVIHAAFEQGPESVEVDRAVVEGLTASLRSSDAQRTFLYTSGVLCLGNTGDVPADENAPARAVPVVAWRPSHEQLALAAATSGLSTAVIRPGFVYGGTKGFLAGYFESAVREGAVAYVGDGRNRMALVHKDDLAHLYRWAVENRARGIFHGVDGTAPRVAELARAASTAAGKGGAARSIPLEEARQIFGPFADALCTDQVVVASRSAELGWRPSHRPPLESMTDAFAEWTESRCETSKRVEEG